MEYYDKHNQPEQHCPHGCAAHARWVGGIVGTMGPVYVVCCVPGICPSCARTANEPWRENRQHLPIHTYKTRTYKVRPLALKPGRSSYPLPPEKTLSACHALRSTRKASRPRPMCPAGLAVPSTWCFAEKCSYEEKSWQKYENLTNIRIHIRILPGHVLHTRSLISNYPHHHAWATTAVVRMYW